MSYHKSPADCQSFQVVRQEFLQADGLPFSEILSEEQIEQTFDEAGNVFGQEDDDVYTPALTLWTLLSQVIHAGAERSCNAAVERLRTLCLVLGIRAPSPDSGAYCRARAKISESVLQSLTYQVADELEQQIPEKITVRELVVQIKIPGCRTSRVTLVTTLTDAKQYCQEDLGDLYRQRWHAKLDIRSLKITMHLDDLRGTRPHIVRNELWAHCLAYNLLRKTVASAAVTHECKPRSIRTTSWHA